MEKYLANRRFVVYDRAYVPSFSLLSLFLSLTSILQGFFSPAGNFSSLMLFIFSNGIFKEISEKPLERVVSRP